MVVYPTRLLGFIDLPAARHVIAGKRAKKQKTTTVTKHTIGE